MLRIAFVTIPMLATGLCLAQTTPHRKLEQMSPQEVEAVSNELIAACKRAGIDTGSRAFDDCVKREAKRRGLI